MSAYRSELLNTLSERGHIYQASDIEALDELAAKQSITAYIGFDATATSLHVGSLVQIMTLRRLQQTGHKPIVLMGGGTTKIGDPSDKDTSRPLLTNERIDANIASLQDVFHQFLSFGSEDNGAIMVNNADWLDELSFIPFLREIGRHITINRMLGFEAVRRRLDREQPLTLLEFNYMVLQAYDFLELNRRFDCCLQFGGSEQWGNILNGVELCRRIDEKQAFALTTPLITTASGAKMGKTADGAVWLRADQRSPYDYWQFWRNTEDADVERFLAMFTELPMDEVKRLGALQGAEINEAKKILATEATRLAHGDGEAEKAAETARETFEAGAVSAGLPTIDVARSELDEGIPAFALFRTIGLTASAGEARRLISQGGGRLNDTVIGDPSQIITANDAGPDGFIKLSAGKKRHSLVRPA
ncbi:MAG: tyrosine--tRNA ligase [Pseudomonadota bacterium]